MVRFANSVGLAHYGSQASGRITALLGTVLSVKRPAHREDSLATRLRRACDALATRLRRACDALATRLRRACDALATRLRRACDAFSMRLDRVFSES